MVLSNADRKHAADLVLQVKALDSLSQELLVTRDAALEASKRKSEMVSVVSHDLRAPLSSIKGSLSLLNNGSYAIDSDGAELAAIAYTSCDYLLNLINDLLDLESIESGGITLKKSEVPVQQLVDDAFRLVRSVAKAKCISLVADVGTMTVFADKERLLQVLINLLSNAIKFSPPDSQVIVTAQASNGVVNISVADQGRGIPPELTQSIFDRFTQAQATDRQDKGGAGLGLAICKAFLEAHGSAIRVESEEGKGSTFLFSLPLFHITSSKNSITSVGTSAQAKEAPAKNFTVPTLPIRRILLIDDSYDDFDLMQRQFARYKEAGLVIEHSDCLAAANKRLALGSIDVIFLDLSLPDSQGIDTIKKVHAFAPAIPIVVLSGIADIDIALAALSSGAEDYLIKGSFEIGTLYRSLNYAVARHAAREARERLATIVEACDDAIISKTLNGTITSWNKGASKLFGYSAEEATGKSMSMLFPPESPTELIGILKAIANGETIQNRQTVRIRKDGERIDILATISPIVGVDGKIIGAAAVDRDVTEHNRQHKAVLESAERHRLAVAGVKTYAIFMLDHKGFVTSWNYGANQMKGYEAEEVTGKHFSIFYNEADRRLGVPESNLETALQVGSFEGEGWRLRKDGSSFFADVVITPAFDANHTLCGFTKVVRDITKHKLN